MILVCGEALVDVLATPQTGGGTGLDARLGGAPFNLAIGLARLGQRVAFYGGLSTDPLGAALAERLADEGVDASVMQRSDATTMLAIVGVDREGHPAYAFPIVDGADKRLSVPDFTEAFRATLQAATFGSYLAMIEPAACVMRRIARALRAHAVICLDPNVRPSIAADPVIWRQGIEDFLPIADIVKTSEEDIRFAFGPSADIDTVARDWLARGPLLTVVTRGGGGAVALTRAGVRLEMPALPVSVVDTVGAGDAFFAGLLDALSRARLLTRAGLGSLGTRELRAAVAHATRVAAITCTRRGADLPTTADLLSQPKE